MNTCELIQKNQAQLQAGQTTVAQLKGVPDEAMAAGVFAAQRLSDQGEHQAAVEILAGLALYDPYRPDVWSALESLFVRMRLTEQARVYGSLARAMAA